MRICAVTVLYHPGAAAADHIQSYLGLVQQTFLIDNSETPTSAIVELINSRWRDKKVQLISNGENIGVAAALNQGFRLAEQAGFDWILTMDQDSYFEGDRFFQLAAPLLQQTDMGIIAPSYRNKNSFEKPFSGDFNQYLCVITSGNLVSLRAWKNIGGFEEKLFIDEVDNEFCLRLAKHRFKVIGSKEVFLKHGLGEPFTVKIPFSGKQWPLGIHSPLRAQYTVRNRFFIIKKYLFLFPAFCLDRLWHTLLLLGFIIFLYPRKRKYLGAFFGGIADFFRSKYRRIEADDKSSKF